MVADSALLTQGRTLQSGKTGPVSVAGPGLVLDVCCVIFVDLLLNSDRQTPNPFANLVRLHIGEVQTHMPLAFLAEAIACVERIPGHERDVLFKRCLEQLLAIHTLRSEEHTSELQ